MVPTGNKANRLSSVNHTTKTIHHHHHHQGKTMVPVNFKRNLHHFNLKKVQLFHVQHVQLFHIKMKED